MGVGSILLIVVLGGFFLFELLSLVFTVRKKYKTKKAKTDSVNNTEKGGADNGDTSADN